MLGKAACTVLRTATKTQGLGVGRLSGVQTVQSANIYGVSRIGDRDWVGHGLNGEANYLDRIDFPFPAVRFSPNTAEVKALREKEKCDWKKLSLEEKKKLYRASFCQTFAEINAPTGEWKSIVGLALGFASLSLWVYMALKTFVYKPLPASFSEESRRAQFRRMLDLRVGRIDGLSSQWDFEKDDWKK